MAEFIRVRTSNKYPKQMHIDCYYRTYPSGNAGYYESMMNNFWSKANCAYCGHKLQCKCSKFKVTEPETGKCNHA